MSQIIDLRTAVGGVEYTYPLTITETTGKDISGDQVQLALALTNTVPTVWQAPDLDPPQAVKSQRIVQMLIGGNLKPAAGTYYLWSRVTDSPEVVPRKQQRVVILA